MFLPNKKGDALVMKLGLLPLAPSLHPFKRMGVIDDVLERMFRGAYTLGIVSGATPAEMVAGFNVQMRKIVGEMGSQAFEQTHAIAARYYDVIHAPQEVV